MNNQTLIKFLNQLLSNHFVMYIKLHRYHWFIQGEHFFTLHHQFEKMYRQLASDLDNVAERIVMIGGKPLATMSKYLEESTLIEANADDTEEEIIEQLTRDYGQMVDEIKKEGIPFAEKVEDEPTIDMLIALQKDYETYIWMLSAYQKQ